MYMLDALLYPRFAKRRLSEALAYSPAVLIQGSRQCGKTTLALTEAVPGEPSPGSTRGARERDWLQGLPYFNFDDEFVRTSAEDDPVGFVSELRERAILDQVQRVPRLFSVLKHEIDRRRSPGRFILIGSSNATQIAELTDSLIGRLETVDLYPLAQCELERAEAEFLDMLFGGQFGVSRSERLGARLAERIEAGSYPAALQRPAGRMRIAWYREHIRSVLDRDVPDLGGRGVLKVLPKLLEVAAGQTARLFNASDLAAPCRASRPTIRKYAMLLKHVFLVDQLLPWHNDRLKRLVKTPKLHIGDTGLACVALNANASRLMADRSLLDQLLETFVFQELRRQASWNDQHMEFFHYRDRDDAEVDIVIERESGDVAGVEVKASSTVRLSDFKGLRKLAKAAGERFAGGVVLYDGEMSVTFGDGMYAVPVRRLWEGNGSPS